MADCRYCGKPAGLLKKQHQECATQFREGWDRMLSVGSEAIRSGRNLERLEQTLSEIGSQSFHSGANVRQALVRGWHAAVDQFLENGLLTEEGEQRLSDSVDRFSFSEKDIGADRERLVKATVLREVAEGKVLERVGTTGNIPLNPQKSEKLIWVFQDVDYYEQRKRRRGISNW